MLRKVRIGDATAVAAIYNRYVMETTVSFETEAVSVGEMTERIRDISASYPYLVYEADGDIKGYCYAHPWKERAAYAATWETTVYLSPDSRGCGIGRMLMERLIASCRDAGAHVLIACITSENEASIAFHKSLGFREVSRFHEVGRKFDRWLDVVDMQLIL